MTQIESEYKIAMFGPKNAGKTVFLTTLYSHSGTQYDKNSADFSAVDDATHDYLSKSYEKLCEGQWPDATAFAKLKAVRFVMTSEGVASRVNIPDVAGEVTGRGEKIDNWSQLEHDLKAEILREFSSYDGFLIFAPADDTVEGKYLQFKWEIDALLGALRERSADGIIHRPVAVVLSKCDIVEKSKAEFPNIHVDAAEFFANTYPQVASALAETCKNSRVFPVSATGPTENGRPPKTLAPSGLVSPMLWLVRTADESALLRADEYAEKHKHHLFERVERNQKNKYIDRAIARYQTVLAKAPPVAIKASADESLRVLVRKCRARQVRLTSIATVSLAGILGLVLTVVDIASYREAHQLLANAGQAKEEIGRALVSARSYINSGWRLPAWVFGLKSSLRDYADSKESEWENEWVNRLQSTSYDQDISVARNLIDECEVFTHRFSESNQYILIKQLGANVQLHVHTKLGNLESERLLGLSNQSQSSEQLENWVANAQSFLNNEDYSEAEKRGEVQSAFVRLQTELANRRVEKGWLEFQQQFAELAERPWNQYLLAKAWRSKNPESSHVNDVQKLIATALKAADHSAWNEVQEYKATSRTNYRKIIEIVHNYLSNVEFDLHRATADKFLTEQQNQWDEQLYRFITEESVKGVLTGNQLRSIRSRCDAYTESSERPVAMRSAVETWIRWYDELQNGVTADVVLESVNVMRGSKWHGMSYWPTVYVAVSVNQRKDQSKEKNLSLGVTTPGFPDSDLGPFSWKWGQRDVSVSITCTDYTDETLTAKLADDEFMLRHLNSTVSFDDGKILVRLKCSKAQPPSFPPYESVK